MRNTGGLVLLAVVGLFLSGCNKPAPATADSAATSGGSAKFDRDSARAEIIRADSAWMRLAMAKQVDSLMPYYTDDAVSLSEGVKAVKGKSDLRTSYTNMLKANFRDMKFTSGGVEFSDDGTMAWDYGSFTGTVDGPKGKPMKVSGNALNVWKKVGGRWVMAAEISNSAPVT